MSVIKYKYSMQDLQILNAKLHKVATITMECLPEHQSICGNVLASGDPKTDRDAEDWVRSELTIGNQWAWCTVRVTAEWRGIKGTDTLGCCSYENKESFLAFGGYYQDMVEVALDELTLKIYDLGKAIEVMK